MLRTNGNYMFNPQLPATNGEPIPGKVALWLAGLRKK